MMATILYMTSDFHSPVTLFLLPSFLSSFLVQWLDQSHHAKSKKTAAERYKRAAGGHALLAKKLKGGKGIRPMSEKDRRDGDTTMARAAARGVVSEPIS